MCVCAEDTPGIRGLRWQKGQVPTSREGVWVQGSVATEGRGCPWSGGWREQWDVVPEGGTLDEGREVGNGRELRAGMGRGALRETAPSWAGPRSSGWGQVMAVSWQRSPTSPQNHGRGPCGMGAMRLPGMGGSGWRGRAGAPNSNPGEGVHPEIAGCFSFLGPPQAFSDLPLSLHRLLCFLGISPSPLPSLSSQSSPNGPSSEKPSRFLWAHTSFCRTGLSQKLLSRG